MTNKEFKKRKDVLWLVDQIYEIVKDESVAIKVTESSQEELINKSKRKKK